MGTRTERGGEVQGRHFLPSSHILGEIKNTEVIIARSNNKTFGNSYFLP
jgi:hypothetical protein